MDTLYFDWSHRTGVQVLGEVGSTPTVYPTLDDVLDAHERPLRLIGEATFESYDRARHDEFIRRCRREGVELLTVPNRLTGRGRKALGLEKTDANDVRTIRWLVQQGAELHSPPLSTEVDSAMRVAANNELRDLRRTIVERTTTRTGKQKTVTAKEQFSAQLIELLPDYSTLDEVTKKALGDGKSYNDTAVAAVGAAAKYATSERQFDSLAGLHSHAYPSQIRADLHHYVWAGGNSRARLVKEDLDRGVATRKDGLTFSQFRRALRWLYRQLRPMFSGGCGMADSQSGMANSPLPDLVAV